MAFPVVLSYTSFVIGIISFFITILNLLALYASYISTLQKAPVQIRDILGNLRQEICEERIALRQQAKEIRSRRKHFGTRLTYSEETLALHAATLRDIWREFKQLERPFLVASGLRAEQIYRGDLWGESDLENEKIRTDIEKHGEAGSTANWTAYYKCDVSHRIIWLRCKSDVLKLEYAVSRIMMRRLAREVGDVRSMVRHMRPDDEGDGWVSSRNGGGDGGGGNGPGGNGRGFVANVGPRRRHNGSKSSARKHPRTSVIAATALASSTIRRSHSSSNSDSDSSSSFPRSRRRSNTARRRDPSRSRSQSRATTLGGGNRTLGESQTDLPRRASGRSVTKYERDDYYSNSRNNNNAATRPTSRRASVPAATAGTEWEVVRPRPTATRYGPPAGGPGVGGGGTRVIEIEVGPGREIEIERGGGGLGRSTTRGR